MIIYCLVIFKLTTKTGVRMPPATPGSWTCRPQTHESGALSVRWPVTELAGRVSPSALTWTCCCCCIKLSNSSFVPLYLLLSSMVHMFLAGNGTVQRQVPCRQRNVKWRWKFNSMAIPSCRQVFSLKYSGSFAKIFSWFFPLSSIGSIF